MLNIEQQTDPVTRGALGNENLDVLDAKNANRKLIFSLL